MEENLGFGFGIGRLPEGEEVAVGPQAADDFGAGRGVQVVALLAHGDGAVIGDAHGRTLAPDEGPPGTSGGRADDGAFFGQCLVPCGLGRRAQFAVDFMLIGVGESLVQEAVGPFEFHDLVGGQEGGEAFLLVVVAAFNFAFGLALGTRAEVVSVELIETGVGQTQFGGGHRGGEMAGTMVGEDLTNERSRKAMD